MGCAESKQEGNEALFLCKERLRFIKQAIDSRYALSASQLSYIQSLRNLGVALRQFAECETLVESSLSTSEPDKTPSHSSYASPSPNRIAENAASPRNSGSPLSPRLSNLSYMRANASSPLKFMVDSGATHFVDEESLAFPPPPPPPLDTDTGLSWDFFDPSDSNGNARVLNGGSGINENFSRLVGLDNMKEEGMAPLIEVEEEGEVEPSKPNNSHGNSNCTNGDVKEKDEMNKTLCNATEDASNFITHGAKDFVSSVKDIEHRFVKAAESGHEVSRMLETKKIRLSITSEIIGKSSASTFSSVLNLACCNAGSVAENGSAPHVTKVITWNRSISSQSSSSKVPLTTASKDDCGESFNDFIEEFCMISGSHSSTMDRLYAWERKLYDEVKASETIRKAYDQKCAQLRHQFAKDMHAKVIDKTRATVKDLHSQVRVAIQSVDSISKRIEKLRDEELQPQLLELIQGLLRMWRAMLECYHAQHITISLAYQMKPPAQPQQSENYKQAITHLQNELECFTSTFQNYVYAQKSYVESLNSWLQKCILPPREKSWRKRKPFSPRQALAPPIFVLCKDWLVGIKSLPSNEMTDALKSMLSNLQDLFEEQREEKQEENSNFERLKTSLTRFFDQLAKFAEGSVKVNENVKRGTEMASDDYVNGGRFRFQHGFNALVM